MPANPESPATEEGNQLGGVSARPGVGSARSRTPPHPLPGWDKKGPPGLRERMERGHAPRVHVTVSKATRGGDAGRGRRDLSERMLLETVGHGGGGCVGVGRWRGRPFQSLLFACCCSKKLRAGQVRFIRQTFVEFGPCLASGLGTALWWCWIRILPSLMILSQGRVAVHPGLPPWNWC